MEDMLSRRSPLTLLDVSEPASRRAVTPLPPLRGKVGMGGMDKIRAGELRKSLTEAERSLWRRLRLRQIGGHKFRRQQLIGGYIVDFVCLEERLIVEVDGGQHSKQGAYDLERDSWLGKQGFLVLRFWNDEILNGIDSVKEKIMNELEKHSDTPTSILPRKGGGSGVGA